MGIHRHCNEGQEREKVMLKKIFTTQQLSLFFQIAVLINITSLFFDIIIYHYFPHNHILKLLNANIDHLSVFMICITIISQALFIFTEKHAKFVEKYRLLALSLEACIGIFIIWLVTIESDIQTKAIIFSSSLSQFNHSYKLIFILAAIFIMIACDFYHTFKAPKIIDHDVPQMLRSTLRIVVRRHLLILICIFGIVQFKTLHKFAQALLHHSQSSFIFDFSLLEFIIPIIWLTAIGYYIYQRKYPNTKAK